MARLSILVSGEGRFTRRLLDSAFFHEIEHLEIAGVISSNPQASALTRARALHVPTYIVDEELFPNLPCFGTALLNKLRDIDTDYVLLDGFTPPLGNVAKHFRGRVMGVRLRAEQQVMDVMVYAADEQGGVGSVVSSAAVELSPEDTQDSFTRRVYGCAHELLTAAVRAWCEKDDEK